MKIGMMTIQRGNYIDTGSDDTGIGTQGQCVLESTFLFT